MEKTCQVPDTCKIKLKPRKQPCIFKHKTLMDTRKKSRGKLKMGQVSNTWSWKLKFRKNDKCLNGNGITIPSVRHLSKENSTLKKTSVKTVNNAFFLG